MIGEIAQKIIKSNELLIIFELRKIYQL